MVQQYSKNVTHTSSLVLSVANILQLLELYSEVYLRLKDHNLF